MNLYDEALEELKCVWNGNELSYPSKTIKALEYAKKEHELLGLYRECNEEGHFWLEIQGRISKLEEELK